MTTATPHARLHRGTEPGDFEAHVGSHILPRPESAGGCWVYVGRALRIDEVRRYCIATLTRDPVADDTRYRTACGTTGCVRPEHLETK